jgi:hypothetical protein
MGFVTLAYDEYQKVVWAFDVGDLGFYFPFTLAWDGTGYRCQPGSFLPAICTKAIQLNPDLLAEGGVFGLQGSPAA